MAPPEPSWMFNHSTDFPSVSQQPGLPCSLALRTLAAHAKCKSLQHVQQESTKWKVCRKEMNHMFAIWTQIQAAVQVLNSNSEWNECGRRTSQCHLTPESTYYTSIIHVFDWFCDTMDLIPERKNLWVSVCVEEGYKVTRKCLAVICRKMLIAFKLQFQIKNK